MKDWKNTTQLNSIFASNQHKYQGAVCRTFLAVNSKILPTEH